MSMPLADDFLVNPGLCRMARWSYQDGFVDGWKLISGERAALPETPAKPDALGGQASYRTGLLHGIEAAKKRKGIA
jgi:hypothetical protein